MLEALEHEEEEIYREFVEMLTIDWIAALSYIWIELVFGLSPEWCLADGKFIENYA